MNGVPSARYWPACMRVANTTRRVSLRESVSDHDPVLPLVARRASGVQLEVVAAELAAGQGRGNN
jgi:hypothetical protein